MNEYIDEFIEYIRCERNYSDYTETNYLIDLENYKEYLTKHRINFKNIDYNHILPYIKYMKEEKKLTPNSINRHLSALRSFYNYLLQENVISSNPFKIVSSQKKDKRLPNYMKYKEFTDMIDSLDNTPLDIRNRALLELLFSTGLRVSELTSIKINDIDFSRMEIRVVGKGNKERIAYFNEHSAHALNNYLKIRRNELLNGKQSEYLFINHIGGVLTQRGVRDIIDRIIKKGSINAHITPHTFRHTFATMLLNEGCDLKSVQELLGHVNMSTTSIYTHITSDKIKDAYLHSHPRSETKN